MTDLSLDIPLSVQIACVEREIRMREQVYPRWVQAKKMSQTRADGEIAAMRAVRETLLRLQKFPFGDAR